MAAAQQQWSVGDSLPILASALLLGGAVGKSAQLPLHTGLPDAMAGPTPVNALIHAATMVKSGVYLVARLLPIFYYGYWVAGAEEAMAFFHVVAWIGAFTAFLAATQGMVAIELKKVLAYSTVSQLSYIVLGALLATEAAILGGALHITMHAFAKITLFFAAGAILVASHKTEVSQLNGLGKQMPWTFLFFTIGACSIIGLPPFGGMWSKWYLAIGTIEAGQWILLAVLMISSLLNIAYLMVIPARAFFASPQPTDGHDHEHAHGEAPVTCLIGMAASSLMCIYLFIHPEPFYFLARLVSQGQITLTP